MKDRDIWEKGNKTNGRAGQTIKGKRDWETENTEEEEEQKIPRARQA